MKTEYVDEWGVTWLWSNDDPTHVYEPISGMLGNFYAGNGLILKRDLIKKYENNKKNPRSNKRYPLYRKER